jgi:dienelactone hydrolase
VFLTASLAAVALATVTACGSEAVSTPSEGRGVVVSATQVADLGPAEVAAVLHAAKFDPAPVRNGVTAYRVVYRTVGTGGEPTTASQLVALPKNDTSDLPVVSWLHGTTVYRGDVASVKDTSSDRAAALLFASTGKAVSAPDYLGLGEGPSAHPYGHPEATVSAPIDALRSARELAGRHGRTLDERVLISGFSQGGPATMLVGRALANGADGYFQPGALAPVGGPFNLTRFVADAADDRIANAQLYLAYLATAWDRMFGLYDVPQQAFREPYASLVDTPLRWQPPTARDRHHTAENVEGAVHRRLPRLGAAAESGLEAASCSAGHHLRLASGGAGASLPRGRRPGRGLRQRPALRKPADGQRRSAGGERPRRGGPQHQRAPGRSADRRGIQSRGGLILQRRFMIAVGGGRGRGSGRRGLGVAGALADEYIELIRAWDDRYRHGPGARIEVFPARQWISQLVCQCCPILGPVTGLHARHEHLDELGIPHLGVGLRRCGLPAVLRRDNLGYALQRATACGRPAAGAAEDARRQELPEPLGLPGSVLVSSSASRRPPRYGSGRDAGSGTSGSPSGPRHPDQGCRSRHDCWRANS